MADVREGANQATAAAEEGTELVWRDGVPFMPTSYVLEVAQRLAEEDAELLRRLAE